MQEGRSQFGLHVRETKYGKFRPLFLANGQANHVSFRNEQRGSMNRKMIDFDARNTERANVVTKRGEFSSVPLSGRLGSGGWQVRQDSHIRHGDTIAVRILRQVHGFVS